MDLERELARFSDVKSSVEIAPGYVVQISPRRIKEIELELCDGLASWLMGLGKQSRLLVKSLFMRIPYTDKVSKIKALGAPNVMFIGSTGVGKTDLIEKLAMEIDAISTRIQGTPDLMPYHVLGAPMLVENMKGERVIRFKPGKIFAHIVRIDESNRMRGQTKSAILEAMEEHSVTPSTEFVDSDEKEMSAIPLFPVSGDYKDVTGPRFFMVLMTQNIFGEEEGTYENPMAELDRTTLTIRMERPKFEDEVRIRARNVVGKTVKKVTNLEEILAGGQHIFNNVGSSESGDYYLTRLLRNTDPETVEGSPEFVKFVREHVRVADSPRVNFHLEAAARVEAFFKGSKEIRPEHVKAMARNVLVHRLRLTAGKEFQTTKDAVFEEILKNTEVPQWK